MRYTRFAVLPLHRGISFSLAMPLLAAACTEAIDGDEPMLREASQEIEGVASGGPGDIRPDVDRDDDSTIVYEQETERQGDTVTRHTENGVFDEDMWRRTASPEDYVEEGVLHHSEAWSRGDDDTGVTVQGYRVRMETVPPVRPDEEPAGLAELDADLVEELSGAGDSDLVAILVKVRDAAAPPLPILPSLSATSAQDYANALDDRRAAYDAHEQDFETLVSSLDGAIATAGGGVVGKFPRVGWLAAEVPASKVRGLLAHADVQRITKDRVIEHAGPDMEALRQDDHMDVQRFDDAGYHGENGASAPLIIGLAEVDAIEDEVCYLDDYAVGNGYDDCDTNERLKLRMDCSSSGCDEDANNDYADGDETYHGTIIASIMGADYSQAQGTDQNIGSGLSAGWEEKASGLVKEHNLHYYMFNGGESNQEQAVECAQGLDDAACVEVDVFNSSNQYYSSSCGDCCTPASSRALEDEIENLYDDGVLAVVSAGNQGSNPSTSACTVTNPADTPKAFAVAATSTSTSTDYNTWGRLTVGSIVSGRGGADIEVPNGTTRTGTMSVVDLAAPGQNIAYVTNEVGTYGKIDPNNGRDGTSYSAPMVSGAALAVYDWLDQTGNTWINDRGKLHVVMLGMGDRGEISARAGGCISGDQIVCGADEILGLGRLKTRLLKNGEGMGPWAFGRWTYTIVSSTADPLDFIALGPMPTGTAMVKCVMQQREDMSGKDNISLIGLWLKVRDKDGSGCTKNVGTVRYTRYDALYDDKHMVAFVDSSTNIEDRCLEVELDRVHLSSANSATLDLFCYYSGIVDDAPT